MEDKDKTQEQLIKELTEMRQQISKRGVSTADDTGKLLRDLANSSPIGIYIVQDGKFRFANSMFLKYAGLSKEELYGMNSLSIVSPENRDMVRENAVKMLKGKRSSPYEFRYINKDGESLWVMETVTSIQYQGRQATLGNFVDITERKRVEEALKESEERLRATVMNAPIGIATSGMDRYFLSVNDAFCRILGYTEAELQKMSFKDITHPEDIKVSIARVDDIDVGKIASFGQEKRYIKKDGKVIIGKVMVSVVRNHEGKPYLYIAELEDITERKQLEEKYRQLIEDMSDGYMVIQEGKCVFANNRFSDIFGYKPGQIIGKPIAQLIMPDDRHAQMERYGRVDRGEESVPERPEGRGMKEDGSIVTIEASTKAIQYDGKPAISVIARDITEFKRAEESLRMRSELLDMELDSVYVYDFKGNFLYVNKAACTTHGYTREELLNINLGDLDDLESAKLIPLRKKEIMERGQATFEVHHRHKNGSLIPLEIHVSIIELNGQKLIMSVARDITERKRATEQLQESETYLKGILDSTGDGILAVDNNGKVIKTNNRFAEMWKIPPELIQLGDDKSLLEYILDQLVDAEAFLARVNQLYSSEKTDIDTLYFKDGRVFERYSTALLLQGIIVGRVWSFRDVTERKMAEESHQKAAKLDSIGTLAGGIAHDFNNILTAILGNIQLAGIYLGKSEIDTAKELLEEAEKASFRARSLTQQLLTFSRGGAPVKKITQIDKLLKESATFVLRGTSCRPEFALVQDLWTVEVDEGQMDRVLSNLVINANHAMPNGGVINISAGNVFIGKQPALSLLEGRYVKITIKDQGIGIPENNKGRIFEPYFTTKGRGSGLGLATSYSIIKNHGGIITFESTLGVGTTFHVYLPAIVIKEKSGEKKIKPAAGAQPLPLAQGRILVMDDEETIRKLLGRMLQGVGYEVELTGDGAEAIERYTEAKKSGKSYDVVILDLTIPGGMGGKETMAKLLEIDPGVKAIVSSGYANDPIMADYRKYGFSGVVTKPYNLAQMKETLRNILIDK